MFWFSVGFAGSQGLELPLHLLELLIGAMLEVDELIARRIDASKDLIELQVQGPGIAVLRILHQEHHQERNNGGAGVDDQLPGVGISKERTRWPPRER